MLNPSAILYFFFIFSDKPATPTIIADKKSPEYGDNVVLTCSTATASPPITRYEFRRGATLLDDPDGSNYTISATDVGESYTCTAYIDTVASLVSPACK